MTPSETPRSSFSRGGSLFGARGLLMAGLLVLLGWFYLWTATPAGSFAVLDPGNRGYYNLLVRGWAKGQLALDVPDDPFLAALANPYDPVQRQGHGRHDASYYGGRFHLYFGVTPVLLLQFPCWWLTGSYITDGAAVALFSYVGCLLALGLLLDVMRTWFPRTPLALQAAAMVALGWANMVPPLLRRPEMWEVPIACGYMLFMGVLWCVWRGLAKPLRPGWWVLASLLMGLCVGARPTYLFGSLVLLAPLPGLLRQGRAFWTDRAAWRLVLAILGPITCVGIGLAAYNAARFGNPFEFGQTYQLSGSGERDLVHFSPGYIWFNVQVYLFSMPGISPYFPFLAVISPPPIPPGQFGIENPYGIVPGMPWVLLALVALGLAWRHPGRLATWCLATLAGVGATMLTIFSFGGATGRYEVDFTPGLVLVGAIGAFWLAAGRTSMVGRRGWNWLVLGLAAWSAAFNILVSLQHNRLLEMNSPKIYARLAHASNHLSHALAGLTGHRDGPVEIRLRFPAKGGGVIEPLVVTGNSFLADYVFVHYLEPGLIRFGLEHTSRGTWTSHPVEIDPGVEHTLVVKMGSLYPPRDHPAHDGLSEAERNERLTEVRIILDGRTALRASVVCYDSTDWSPSIGTSQPGRPAFKQDFSGRISSWRRWSAAEAAVAPAASGRMHLVLALPEFVRAHSEPILSSGIEGRGDLIYCRYLDARRVVLGHDQWGRGGWESAPIELVPGEKVELDISCPPLLRPGAPSRLAIRWNGRLIVDQAEAFHPSRPEDVRVGVNAIGASTAEAAFTGTIELQERVRDASE
jgi:hypothetical protein